MIVATKDKNWNIVRLNSDGKTVDTSFAANGVLSVNGISNVPQYGWEVDDKQRILVLTKDYWNVQGLSRYNADGTLDTTFATGGTLTYPPVTDPTNLLTLQDGRILIGGKLHCANSITSALRIPMGVYIADRGWSQKTVRSLKMATS